MPVAVRSRSAALLLAAWVAALAGCAAGSPGTPPAAAERRGDVRVVVISDLNSAYGSTEYEPEVHQAVRLIRERWRPDLVLAAGDLIAGQRPSLPDSVVRAMWSAFDAAVAAPLREAGIPFGFTLGNHDGSAYPAHARDRALAEEHWRAPERDPGVRWVDRGAFPRHHTFREGEVFVLSWDASNQETARDTAMMRWVEAQLSGEAARGARFRVVLGHLPLYAVAEGRNRPGEVLAAADTLRGFLERHRVDLYVSGHHHAFFPGRRGGLELLHTGALGQGARTLLGSSEPPVQTVTVLDFHVSSGTIDETTYILDGSAGTARRIALDSLPRRIDGFNGYVVRRDLPDPEAAGSP